METELIWRCLTIAALTVIPLAAHAAQPARTVTYFQVVSAYMKDAKAAAEKYDHQRLAMKGYLIRMGSEPNTTFFGAIQDDGQKFDTTFNVEDQAALKTKFPGGNMGSFKPSKALVFECLNEGYVPEAMTIKLTNCKMVE